MSSCHSQNRLIAIAQINVIGYFIDYLGHDKGHSAKTLGLYYSHLRQLLDFFVRKVSKNQYQPYWANCDKQVIKSYFLHLRKKGNAPTTIARKMAVIDSFFEFLVAEGYTKNNPTKKLTLVNAGLSKGLDN